MTTTHREKKKKKKKKRTQASRFSNTVSHNSEVVVNVIEDEIEELKSIINESNTEKQKHKNT